MEEVIYETMHDQPNHVTHNVVETTVDGPVGDGESSIAPEGHQVTTEQLIQIKQELNDNSIELDGESQIHIEDGMQGVQVSIDEFVQFHNEQMKNMNDQKVYLSRGLEIYYKFKTVLDMVIEDYFKDDKMFKYKSLIQSLETDLFTYIAEDEEKYQSLVENINTDIVLNEDNELEFVELDNPNEEDAELVNGVNEFGPSTIRKLPGQRSAPLPECPACGIKVRCRLKLEAHLLEHKDNPLVICNHDKCEIAFELHNLAQHEKDYHQEICLICEMCNEMFVSKSSLVQHYKLHITKKERLKCNFPGCDYTDIYVGRMDRHKKTAHNIEVTKQFRCDFEGCGRMFKDRPSYYTHSLIHKDRSLVYKHRCTYENCSAVFKRRRNLSLHLLKHGFVKRNYVCRFGECGRAYTKEKDLMRHIELVHQGSLKAEPNDSDTALINDQISKQDIQDDTNDENKMELEGAGTESLEENGAPIPKRIKRTKSEMLDNEDTAARKLLMIMNKNAKNVNEDNDSQQDVDIVQNNNVREVFVDAQAIGTRCELCEISYETSEELLNHLKERHHQYTIKAYTCDFDGCTFTTHFRSVLGRHKNEMHGGKYKCEVCGKLSKDSGNHNRHRNIHKNILYRCRVPGCEAVYKSPKAYYVHVLTHSNEQPVYSCNHPGCKYITYYVNTLNVHKLTHSDERKYFCNYDNCKKGFKRNGDLNKHILHSHKGVKRPTKKRRNLPSRNASNNNNDDDLANDSLKCSFHDCPFIGEDAEHLAKHEQEHLASDTVQEY